MRVPTALLCSCLLALLVAMPAQAQRLAAAGSESFDTEAPPQLVGDSPATGEGWSRNPLFTVGETIGDYTPPGIPDGIGAIRSGGVVRLLVNHELGSSVGYPYQLGNGLSLTGARVSFFDVDPNTREIVDAGLAYDRVFDRYGNAVTAAQQVNEGTESAPDGFERFCSSGLFIAGEYGLVDNIYLTGEETGGGQEFALTWTPRTPCRACPRPCRVGEHHPPRRRRRRHDQPHRRRRPGGGAAPALPGPEAVGVRALVAVGQVPRSSSATGSPKVRSTSSSPTAARSRPKT